MVGPAPVRQDIFLWWEFVNMGQCGGYSVMQRSGAGERQPGRYAPLSNHAPVLCGDEPDGSHAQAEQGIWPYWISKKVCWTRGRVAPILCQTNFKVGGVAFWWKKGNMCVYTSHKFGNRSGSRKTGTRAIPITRDNIHQQITN